MAAASALECLANRAEIGPRRVTAIAANLVTTSLDRKASFVRRTLSTRRVVGSFFESGPPMLIDKSS